MRLLIDGGGYATAATAFADANQVAALQYDSLTGKLAGLGAMAGDDSTSTDFATAYDDAAVDAVAALGDLVGAFATLGRLTEQCVANHLEANARSVLGGAVVYAGTLPDTGYVTVLAATPPTCLGGDPPALSPAENWILDQIQGFIWPNADTDKLRDAAHAWRTAAEGLDQLTTYCNAATRSFEAQSSPEIPVAIAVTDDVKNTIRDLADQCSAIGDTCESHAAGIDEQRQLILDLVLDLLRDSVILEAIGLVLAPVTAGITAAGASAINAARIGLIAPRILRILAAIRALAATAAYRLGLAGTRLSAARRHLSVLKLARARSATASSAFGPRSLGAAHRLRYEASPKHGLATRGRSSAAPTNGQEALDFSVPIRRATTTRRVAVDTEAGEFVVFDETMGGVFHGHVRTWAGLTHSMQRALQSAGLVDRRGRIIGGGGA